MNLKSLNTDYHDCRFRSRLEARWAVFFDKLGVKWEYEKEGYDLGAAGWYLPDFWLPEWHMWVEVKGEEISIEDRGKVWALVQQSGMAVCVVYSFDRCTLFHVNTSPQGWDSDWPFYAARYIAPQENTLVTEILTLCAQHAAIATDDPQRIPLYQTISAKNDELGALLAAERAMTPDARTCFRQDRRMSAAITAAKSARFEHGEVPWVNSARH